MHSPPCSHFCKPAVSEQQDDLDMSDYVRLRCFGSSRCVFQALFTHHASWIATSTATRHEATEYYTPGQRTLKGFSYSQEQPKVPPGSAGWSHKLINFQHTRNGATKLFTPSHLFQAQDNSGSDQLKATHIIQGAWHPCHRKVRAASPQTLPPQRRDCRSRRRFLAIKTDVVMTEISNSNRKIGKKLGKAAKPCYTNCTKIPSKKRIFCFLEIALVGWNR